MRQRRRFDGRGPLLDHDLWVPCCWGSLYDPDACDCRWPGWRRMRPWARDPHRWALRRCLPRWRSGEPRMRTR